MLVKTGKMSSLFWTEADFIFLTNTFFSVLIMLIFNMERQ